MDADKDTAAKEADTPELVAGAPEMPEAEESSEDSAHTVEPSMKSAEDVAVESEAADDVDGGNEPKSKGEKFAKLKSWAHAYWARRKWTLPVTVLGLIILLLAVPLSRYPILGLVWKKDASVVVVDSATGQPVTGAAVSAGGASVQTDNRGVAKLHVGVGPHNMTITKKYYKTYSGSVFASMFSQSSSSAKVVATGRQVPITVTDYITGKPVENVVLKAAGSSFKTDAKGKATLVLPVGKSDQDTTLTRTGYNDKKVSVLVTTRVVTTNNFTVTPTGKLYFLSNQSGNIDVVKTDLDGANRKTVLAGTGKEDTYSTALLASRDWKYLALLSNRDGQAGIYLIKASDDSVTNIDGGSAQANFALVGWSGDTFVYQVNRTNVSSWQSGASALKSYDATSGKLYNLDQTSGEGTSQYDYGSTSFSTVALLDDEIVYAKNWSSSTYPNHLTGKSDSLISIKPDGSGKKDVKDFPVPAGQQYYFGINTSQYEPYGLYLQVPNNDGTNSYYEYEDGAVTAKSDVTDTTFNKTYPTYLESPSGKSTFWSEVRDNKNTLFVGNSDGQSGKQIASLSDYTPYGWYSDNYLMVSKNGSELYAMPTDGSKPPVKITDYYKPQLTYRGYGGGYGGI